MLTTWPPQQHSEAGPFGGLLAQLQQCPPNLSAPPTCREHNHNQICPLSVLSPTVSSQVEGCIHGSSQPFTLLAFPLGSHLPSLRCFNEWITQVCLCVEQEIRSWVIAVQIGETSSGDTKGISHAVVPLMSLPTLWFLCYHFQLSSLSPLYIIFSGDFWGHKHFIFFIYFWFWDSLYFWKSDIYHKYFFPP